MFVFKAVWCFIVIVPSVSLASPPTMPRKAMMKQIASLVVTSALCPQFPAAAFSVRDVTRSNSPASVLNMSIEGAKEKPSVAYRAMQVGVGGVNVPVAMWYPIDESNKSSVPTSGRILTYDHKISVRRIGQLLAGWEFIPAFATKHFQLKPTSLTVVDGRNYHLPSKGPVVLLAHGYLGSRFDLSHLAEALAKEGRLVAIRGIFLPSPGPVLTLFTRLHLFEYRVS